MPLARHYATPPAHLRLQRKVQRRGASGVTQVQQRAPLNEQAQQLEVASLGRNVPAGQTGGVGQLSNGAGGGVGHRGHACCV